MPTNSREESIFNAALDLADAHERSAYLDQSCGENPELRRRVELLLSAYGEGQFLESPAAGLAATALLPPVGEKPGATIGPYKLLEQIGEGGMGLVFMAEQSQPLRRRVALKIIKPGLDTRAVIVRFEAERQALALMDHPNIARVYDAGATDSGRPYFVMELVRGIAITDYCDRERLSIPERLELFVQVCRAVQHAHQKGVIHRDLKPSNVMVTIIDGTALPKIIDFGVAKATGATLTERTLFTAFNQFVGTPLYMSPEQADLSGVDVDARSDIYSLGVLLYELLTGTTPVEEETMREAALDEVRRIIRDVDPPRPSGRLSTLRDELGSTVAHQRQSNPQQLGKSLRGELDWITMKALDKDRAQRYPTAYAFADDVERFLRDDVVEARRPSRGYLLMKFVRRHRAVAATLSVIAATLATATVVSTMSAVRAGRAERLAAARLVEVARERNEKEASRSRAVASERTAQTARQQAESALAATELARNETAWNLYTTQMTQATAAWESRDYGALGSFLEDMKPADGAPDFRGWEWYFLQRRFGAAFAATPPSPVWQAAWNPTSTELAVVVPRAGQTALVQIWAPDRVTPIRTLAKVTTGVEGDDRVLFVSRVAWSADGRRFACAFFPPDDAFRGSELRSWVSVFDAISGETVFRREVYKHVEHNGRNVLALDLSPDGALLATGTWFGQIKLWDVAEGSLREVLFDPDTPTWHNSLAFSPTGEHLAAALRGGRRVVWSVETGVLFEHEPISNGAFGVVRWSPDAARLAASDGNEIAIYERGAARAVATLPHTGVTALSWPNRHMLVSGGNDQQVKIWNTEKQAAMQTVCMNRRPVTFVDVSHDGKFLAMDATNESAIQVVRLEQDFGKAEVIKAVDQAQGETHLVRWSHDGRLLASGWLIRTESNKFYARIRVVDPVAHRDTAQHEIGILRSLTWSADGASLLAGTLHREFHVLSVENPDSAVVQTDVGGYGEWGTVAVSPDGKWVAHDVHINHRSRVEIRDSKSLKIHQQFPCTPDIRAMKWSPDGRSLLVASYSALHFFNVESGALTSIARKNQVADLVHSAAWDPSSQLIAVGKGDGSIEVWNPKTSAQIAQLIGHQGEPLDLDWSRDGRRLASTGIDGTIRIWDAATGEAVANFRMPRGMRIHSVEWSPDSRQLAAGAENGDLFLFDAGSSIPRSFNPARLATGKIAAAFTGAGISLDDKAPEPPADRDE